MKLTAFVGLKYFLMDNNTTFKSNSPENDIFNLRDFIEKYLYHWKWFLLGLILAFAFAFIYLRYTTPQYEVVSTILIQDKENESIYSEQNAFEDLELVSNRKSQFETEMGILKSRGLMERVVKQLNLNKIYLAQGKLRNSELYGNNLTFKINFFGNDSLISQKDTLLSVIASSPTKFDLLNAKDKKVGSYLFGENIINDFANFTITPTTLAPIEIGLKINIIIKPAVEVADSYRQKIIIEPVNRKSSLIEMSLMGPNKEKSHDILKTLLDQYITESITDKSIVAKNTDEFIADRIDAISKELAVVDNDAQFFLSDNKLTDIGTQTDLILGSNNSLEKEILDIKTQIKLTKYVYEHIARNTDKLIPTDLGLSGFTIKESINIYNEILQERNRLLQNATRSNPIVLNLDKQLDELKASIIQNLENLETTLNISLRDLKNQEAQLNLQITSAPRKEREFRDIERQQKTVETLYLYLLQKREENAIALAVKTPNAKLIDKPYAKPGQAYPRRMLSLAIAAAAGLTIPFIILYLLFLVNNKIHSTDELNSLVDLEVLGGIPRDKSKIKLISPKNNTSSITEAFHVLRTNTNFMLSEKPAGSKTIFVTSTIAGEGKTFTAFNLAKVLAVSTNKVLLINGDIRNSKLVENFQLSKKEGLSDYLVNDTFEANDLIEHFDIGNFDYLQGGTISKNLSELFLNDRFDKLLTYAKQNYDYIIIDTPPITTVTDALVISKDKSDLCVFVVRANYLDKRMLKIVTKLNDSGKLQNIAVVLNDIRPKGLHGYRYKHNSLISTS